MDEQATCLRDRLLVRLLFRLGCRISEALALRVEDIDFERATVTIQHLKSRIRLSCPNCRVRLGKMHSFCPGSCFPWAWLTSGTTKRRRFEDLARVVSLKIPLKKCARGLDKLSQM